MTVQVVPQKGKVKTPLDFYSAMDRLTWLRLPTNRTVFGGWLTGGLGGASWRVTTRLAADFMR